MREIALLKKEKVIAFVRVDFLEDNFRKIWPDAKKTAGFDRPDFFKFIDTMFWIIK